MASSVYSSLWSHIHLFRSSRKMSNIRISGIHFRKHAFPIKTTSTISGIWYLWIPLLSHHGSQNQAHLKFPNPNIVCNSTEEYLCSVQGSSAILVHIYHSACLIDSDWIYLIWFAFVCAWMHSHMCALICVAKTVCFQQPTCQSTAFHVSFLLPPYVCSGCLSHCTLLLTPGKVMHKLPRILFYWDSRSASPFLAFTWVLQIWTQVFMAAQQTLYR